MTRLSCGFRRNVKNAYSFNTSLNRRDGVSFLISNKALILWMRHAKNSSVYSIHPGQGSLVNAWSMESRHKHNVLLPITGSYKLRQPVKCLDANIHLPDIYSSPDAQYVDTTRTWCGTVMKNARLSNWRPGVWILARLDDGTKLSKSGFITPRGSYTLLRAWYYRQPAGMLQRTCMAFGWMLPCWYHPGS